MSLIEKHGQVVQESAKIVDGFAVGAMVGSLMGYFPAIAAAFTIVWTGIRIYETATVQGFLTRRGLLKSKPEPKPKPKEGTNP
ncbi:MAG: hypothetical protein JKY34_07735 [Kordiimonadaceae bacterium]|nr:hypothetical protein [Kordiimonadaceae bacterium]